PGDAPAGQAAGQVDPHAGAAGARRRLPAQAERQRHAGAEPALAVRRVDADYAGAAARAPRERRRQRLPALAEGVIRMNIRWLPGIALLFTACAAQPPIPGAPTLSPAPYCAAENLARYLYQYVLWGGSIVELRQF